MTTDHAKSVETSNSFIYKKDDLGTLCCGAGVDEFERCRECREVRETPESLCECEKENK